MAKLKRREIILLSSFLLAAVTGVATLWYLTTSTISQAPLAVTGPSKEEVDAAILQQKLACVAALPLDVRLGQKLMAATYAANIEASAPDFAAAHIGGTIIMNETPAASIARFSNTMPIRPLVAVDQEGGTVQRYTSHGLLEGAETMAATYAADTAYERYFADATFLKEQGFTTNFAPVVDVASRTPNPLPGRMYSSDPEIVAEYAAEAITATTSAGITPVIKHFPGLGSATGNTDFVTSTIDPLEALEQRDLVPYRVLAHLQPDVMVGNMIVPNLTTGQPAVWSPAAIDLLRSLGYENAVVYSDSLTAAAISGTIEDAVVKAWTAGIDVAVVVQPNANTLDLGAYFAAIIDHGEVSVSQQLLDEATINKSVLRIFERKQLEPCTVSADQN